MGLPSQGDRARGARDGVGFVVTAEQAERLIGLSVESERAAMGEQDARLEMDAESGFAGGICPHDDHPVEAIVISSDSVH